MKLIFVNGKRAGEEFELSPDGVKLGREVDNEISILEAGLSRHHARIEFKDDSWVITDLNSTNGVKVNGVKITEPTTLREGDDISCGNQAFTFGTKKEPVEEDVVVPKTTIGSEETPKDDTGISIKMPDSLSSVGGVNKDAPGGSQDDTGIKISMPDSLSPEGGASEKKDDDTPFKIGSPEPLPDEKKRSSSQTDGELQIETPDQPAEQETKDSPSVDSVEGVAANSRKEEIQHFFESFSSGGKDKMSAQDSRIALDKIDLFGGSSVAEKKKEEEKREQKKKGPYRPSNLLFYVIVIGLAVIAISIFIIIERERQRNVNVPKKERKAKPKEFFIVYEKDIASPDNVFHFYLKIEGDTALVVLDDLKYSRRFYKEFKLGKDFNKENLKEFQKNVTETDFWNLTSPPEGKATDQKDEIRTLTIGYGAELNKITIRNTFAPVSFEKIEAAIDEFSSDALEIPPTATVEEMKARAKQYFENAENLYSNWKANPGNLKDAVKFYERAMAQLNTFEPPPEIWTISNKKSKEARSLLDGQVQSHNFNAKKAYNLKDYATARNEMKQVMELLDSDDPRFKKARDYVIMLDTVLRSRNRQ